MDVASPQASRAKPLLAVGVLTVLRRRRLAREQMRRGWMSLVDDSTITVRFVAACSSAYTPPADTVCVADEEEHPKAVQWLSLALRLFPSTPWVAHCDDDVHLQTRQVLADLSALPSTGETYGLVHVMKRWPTLRSGRDLSGLFDGHLEQWGPAPRLRRGYFPFMQGGFYALTRDLVRLLLPAANASWAARADALRTAKVGEDGLIFHALHAAAARARVSYGLRHLTWTRYHNLAPADAPAGGMGWVAPTAASTVVHWIKDERRPTAWLRAYPRCGSNSRVASRS
jgi:hypothetical protein